MRQHKYYSSTSGDIHHYAPKGICIFCGKRFSFAGGRASYSFDTHSIALANIDDYFALTKELSGKVCQIDDYVKYLHRLKKLLAPVPFFRGKFPGNFFKALK